jgi:ATP-dependent RNA helicase DDX60
MLVEAPTSVGKPFISFTAMEEVLKKDPDSVVVYVAPTKALVNQVAAEVYSNFKDKPKLMKGVKPGTLLFGVFTRDYRLSPAKCRVLVTVPQCLEIMLMAHQNFEGWRDKVKYVIFDEVKLRKAGRMPLATLRLLLSLLHPPPQHQNPSRSSTWTNRS